MATPNGIQLLQESSPYRSVYWLLTLAVEMTKSWNVGIIGYGLSAKIFQIPFICDSPELQLYAVVQRTPQPGNDAEKDHPGIMSYRSADDLISDPQVDIVVITTTPTTHYEFVKLALEKGKHGRS